MPVREEPFVTDSYYHIYNRGVERRKIFLDDKDRRHLLLTFNYYIDGAVKKPLSAEEGMDFRPLSEAKMPLVKMLCFCLMPNHFHLLLQQTTDNGISRYLRVVTDSYTRYFNRRYDRIGPLFQGQFKSVPIKSDAQLLHVSRYIHLNPFLARLTPTIRYDWSSFEYYIGRNTEKLPPLCDTAMVIALLDNQNYQSFVENFADYARQLDTIKHLTHE